MMNIYRLSKREKEVAELLLEGKSNKQIAAALFISDGTVEFHLTKIYTKLSVGSRAEAIIRLSQPGKSLENGASKKTRVDALAVEHNSGESPVANMAESTNNISDPTLQAQEMLKMTGKTSQFVGKYKTPMVIGIILGLIGISWFYLTTQKSWNKYERECEYPDHSTVGKTIGRSNASGSNVHGQFGTADISPWSAQAGSVVYKNISTPKVEQLYLKIRYSKNSPTSVPILIYIDDEQNPRAAIYLKDQRDWNQFAWTEPIYIGSIESGVHSIRLATDGQQYGVADLDKFVLTAGSP